MARREGGQQEGGVGSRPGERPLVHFLFTHLSLLPGRSMPEAQSAFPFRSCDFRPFVLDFPRGPLSLPESPTIPPRPRFPRFLAILGHLRPRRPSWWRPPIQPTISTVSSPPALARPIPAAV